MADAIDESKAFSRSGTLFDLVQQVALAKAKSIADRRPEAYVIGADTIVVLDDHVLGKPKSPSDAGEMLHRLSGRSHTVMTGVAVIGDDGESLTGCVSTSVVFRDLGDRQIADYVASGSPMDKAGGYGIQDGFFAPVSSYDECYLNVVGLPMCTTSELLDKSGLRIPGIIPGLNVCPGHARSRESNKRLPG